MVTIIIVSLNLSSVQKCSKGLCQKDWSSSDKTDNQLSNHGYFLVLNLPRFTGHQV